MEQSKHGNMGDRRQTGNIGVETHQPTFPSACKRFLCCSGRWLQCWLIFVCWRQIKAPVKESFGWARSFDFERMATLGKGLHVLKENICPCRRTHASYCFPVCVQEEFLKV